MISRESFQTRGWHNWMYAFERSLRLLWKWSEGRQWGDHSGGCWSDHTGRQWHLNGLGTTKTERSDKVSAPSARKNSASFFPVLGNRSIIRFLLLLAQMGNTEEIYKSDFTAFHRYRKHRRGKPFVGFSLQVRSNIFEDKLSFNCLLKFKKTITQWW